MAIHKLLIDEFMSIDYGLIAIHSSLEDYRLAYFLNREFGIRLEKCAADITYNFREGESRFSRFIYEDGNESVWNLVQNRNSVSSVQQGVSLFSAEGMDVSTNVFLLPELKKTDYLLKLENVEDDTETEEVTEKLLAIKYITTAYTVDHHKLKSKNNLIF
jgi:hypothetical protein